MWNQSHSKNKKQNTIDHCWYDQQRTPSKSPQIYSSNQHICKSEWYKAKVYQVSWKPLKGMGEHQKEISQNNQGKPKKKNLLIMGRASLDECSYAQEDYNQISCQGKCIAVYPSGLHCNKDYGKEQKSNKSVSPIFGHPLTSLKTFFLTFPGWRLPFPEFIDSRSFEVPKSPGSIHITEHKH